MVFNVFYLENSEDFLEQKKIEEEHKRGMVSMGLTSEDEESEQFEGHYRTEVTPIDPMFIYALNAVDRKKTRMAIRLKNGQIMQAVYDAELMKFWRMYCSAQWAKVAAPVHQDATGANWTGGARYMLEDANYPTTYDKRNLDV